MGFLVCNYYHKSKGKSDIHKYDMTHRQLFEDLVTALPLLVIMLAQINFTQITCITREIYYKQIETFINQG